MIAVLIVLGLFAFLLSVLMAIASIWEAVDDDFSP